MPSQAHTHFHTHTSQLKPLRPAFWGMQRTCAAEASSVTGIPMTPNMCLMPAALRARATRLYPLLPEATLLAKPPSFWDGSPPGCELAAAVPARTLCSAHSLGGVERGVWNGGSGRGWRVLGGRGGEGGAELGGLGVATTDNMRGRSSWLHPDGAKAL